MAVLFVSKVAAEDWPGFRGPHGSGRLEAKLPPGTGELALQVGWSRKVGSGYSGISVAQDVAVTGSSGNGRDLVLAFDPETGEELWAADLGPLTVGIGGSKDGPISTPAIADGRVFVLSTLGRLQAHDLRTGTLLWSQHLVSDLGSERPVYGFATSPVTLGDMVLVQTGGAEGSLTAFDAATGRVRWRGFEDGHYAQSPIVTELAARRQVVVIGRSRIAGYDPRGGEELWTYEHGGVGEFGAESTSPLPIGKDQLFVKHDNERTSLLQIVVRDDESLVAKVVWESRALTRSYSPPTFWGDAAYGYTSRFLSALDLDTGEQLWRSRAPGDGFVVAVEGHLLVANKRDGTVHLGRADRSGWVELDQATIFDDLVWTPPSFSDGAFYVRSLTELSRVDLVRRSSDSSGLVTEALPPELDALRQQIERGGDPTRLVDELLRDVEGPLSSGDRALFLWRGQAEEVGIAGDMFGFRYDEPMRRLDGTDLWWYDAELDRRGRFSYVFFPDYVPTLDPLNPRSVEATTQGPDLNHRDETDTAILRMSWFAMPEWPGHGRSTEESPIDPGRMETFDVTVALPARPAPAQGPGAPPATPARDVAVPVTVWLPPGYDDAADTRYPLVLSLERYAGSIGAWPAALEAVVGKRVGPLLAVMIDPPSGFFGRRGGGQVGLLVPKILEAVDRRYRTRTDVKERAVVGALYTAPTALALSLGEDRLFGRVAVQSPFVLDATLPVHEQRIARAGDGPRPEAFYFEWSYWDMRSRLEGLVLKESMRELFEMFQRAGYEPIGGEVWDSTDWAGWRNRTGVVLEALFPSADGDVDAALEPWRVRQ